MTPSVTHAIFISLLPDDKEIEQEEFPNLLTRHFHAINRQYYSELGACPMNSCIRMKKRIPIVFLEIATARAIDELIKMTW